MKFATLNTRNNATPKSQFSVISMWDIISFFFRFRYSAHHYLALSVLPPSTISQLPYCRSRRLLLLLLPLSTFSIILLLQRRRRDAGRLHCMRQSYATQRSATAVRIPYTQLWEGI